MRIAIIGSRGFNDYDKLEKTLNEYLDKEDKVSMIVSGGARGADSLGERWAKENGIETLIFLPDWNKHGKSAGYIRNKDIIENSDLVIAFWDGVSKGTKHSIDIARSSGKEVIIK